jgi:hypothetical protein
MASKMYGHQIPGNCQPHTLHTWQRSLYLDTCPQDTRRRPTLKHGHTCRGCSRRSSPRQILHTTAALRQGRCCIANSLFGLWIAGRSLGCTLCTILARAQPCNFPHRACIPVALYQVGTRRGCRQSSVQQSSHDPSDSRVDYGYRRCRSLRQRTWAWQFQQDNASQCRTS